MTTNHAAHAERLAARAQHFSYGDGADPATGTALAAEGLIHAVLHLAEQLAPKTLDEPVAAPQRDATAYRAECCGVPLGTYWCIGDAQAHCETQYRDALPAPGDGPLHWYPNDDRDDSEDPAAPLRLYQPFVDADGENPTEYTVTPIVVWADFDPAREG
ncbi:hypothetical protein [Phaeacidiphilus oryzae]|uniref:hypothetical protein n=1 Tax=Phaeacidiphilus oryzae TaxID=348818 RepID=UPI00056CAB35|nr:hypothetical protein [Phaeacidiphilus oryzae]